MVSRIVSIVFITGLLGACITPAPQGRTGPADGGRHSTRQPAPQTQPRSYPQTQPAPRPVPQPRTQPRGVRQPVPAQNQRPVRAAAPSPAVVSLSKSASQHYSAGRYPQAASSLERALKIAPRDPGLWSDLGRVRHKQERFSQAEGLLLKSNSLAGLDNTLRVRNWRLIADARRAAGDRSGARAAEQEARHLERGN